MPSTKCPILLETVGMEIYSRNPFRLLALPVDAKNRQIRRQEKELIAALESNELAEEYSNALRPDPLPTREEISEAARQLADPQKRFIYEFFWFWPTEWGKGRLDEILPLLNAGKLGAAQKEWNQEKTIPGEAGLASSHNLAVLGHMLAIQQEQQAISGNTAVKLSEEERLQLNQYWGYSFKYWEALHGNDAFWSMLSDRVRGLKELRLTARFVSNFTYTLPVAFDNINADLAVAFCNCKAYDRANDHIRIMKATNEGEDDVDASIRRVTIPLQKRIDQATETATKQLMQNRTLGKERCIDLFDTARDTLNVLGVLLGNDSSEFTGTCDRIALSMLRCQVAYGNETEDWGTCIPLLESALKIAKGKEAKERMQKNLQTIRMNAQLASCWFCSKNPREESASIEVNLERTIYWRDVRRNPQKYSDILESMLSELQEMLNEDPIALFRNHNLRKRLASSNINDKVWALDEIVNDSTELMTQTFTTDVPRCASCKAQHDEISIDSDIKPFSYYEEWPGVLEAKEEGLSEKSVSGKPKHYISITSSSRRSSYSEDQQIKKIFSWGALVLGFLFALPIFPYSGWIGFGLTLASCWVHPCKDLADDPMQFPIIILYLALLARAFFGILAYIESGLISI